MVINAKESRSNRSMRRQLIAIFSLIILLGCYPLLAMIQYRYFPVLEEFDITDVQKVAGPHRFVISSSPREEIIVVGNGFIFSGIMHKSSLYPKWLCSYQGTDATQTSTLTNIEYRVGLLYGDQPSNATATRKVGKQYFYNWYVENANTGSGIVRTVLDIHHRCFGFFPTLQRMQVDIDTVTNTARTKRLGAPGDTSL